MSDSAEYKAFKDCHSSLFTCVKQSPKDVSDHLLPFEILAPNDRDYLKNDTHDDGDKARRILDAVLLQMENDPLVFHSFVSALEAAGSFTKATVKKLIDALQRQHQQCDQTPKFEESGDTSVTKYFQRDVQQESMGNAPPQNVTVPPDIEDQETPDYSDHEESMEDAIHTQGLPVQQQGIELVSTHFYKTSKVPVPAVNNPGNDKDESVPLIKSPSSTKKIRCLGKYFIHILLLCSCPFLNVLCSLLYGGYALAGTTSVVQIHRQSVPLIGTLDNLTTFDILRLSESTDVVPISFYTIYCSSNDSFMDVEVNETVTVNFSSPTEKTKAVTELYLLENTTLALHVTTEAISNNLTDICIAFIFIFDDFNNFVNFTSSSSLVEDFYYKGCINNTNKNSGTMNITFDKPSYYYIGVYTDIVTPFSLHLLGTYLQYNISNVNVGCSIDSLDNVKCDFSLNTNQQTCIVGFVPPSTTLSGIKRTTVDFYTAIDWNKKIDIYFFFPLLLFVSLITIFLLVLKSFYSSFI